MGRGAMRREQTEESVARYLRRWEELGFGLWAVEEKEGGAFVGRIGLLYHEDRPEGEHKTEVGWLLDCAFWHRGLATEGARASLDHGFGELGLERVISFTVPENVASRRVMEKCGLTFRRRTRWRGLNHVWYAIDRRNWQGANPDG